MSIDFTFPVDEELSSSIEFHANEVTMPPIDLDQCKEWLYKVALTEQKDVQTLNIVFVSDEALLKMNIEHLKHDYFTDIITFDYSDEVIEGDLYISIDRVQDNASKLEQSYITELHRVIVHGVLHLIGYGDKSQEEIKTMRSKEGFYLKLLQE